MNRFKCAAATAFFLLAVSAWAEGEEEKNPEDPTKVVTKLGVAYNGDLNLSGSLSVGQGKKISGRINEDASEWRIGGSWLFDFGIVNVNFSRTDFDGDAYKNNYSIGTFLPLNVFGVDTGKWQVFPMAGFSHNDGQNYIEAGEPLFTNDFVLVPNSSDGGYIGAFALRPINEQWTFMSVLGGSLGSNSYAGVWAGMGLSCRLTEKQSMNVFGFISEDDFGRVEKLSLSYTIEF